MKTFDELYREMQAKVAAADPHSSTAAAVATGVHSVGKKVLEEAAEAWMAAQHEDRQRTAEEISQLLYWTLALMLAADLSIEDVYREL